MAKIKTKVVKVARIIWDEHTSRNGGSEGDGSSETSSSSTQMSRASQLCYRLDESLSVEFLTDGQGNTAEQLDEVTLVRPIMIITPLLVDLVKKSNERYYQ